MNLQEKIQFFRKKKGFSQEQLAEQLSVARQTVSKWESGQAVPEISSLIQLSELYGVTVDRLIKDADDCNQMLEKEQEAASDREKIIPFLIRAKKQTYAGHGPETVSSRIASHDLQYQEGDFLYYDTYLGGERFCGEEAVWKKEKPIWCMNYSGRVVGENFSGDFLKEVLSHVPDNAPYRGPSIYQKGDYHYHSKVDGDFDWYQGYEEIFYQGIKIYECFYHGGIVK